MMVVEDSFLNDTYILDIGNSQLYIQLLISLRQFDDVFRLLFHFIVSAIYSSNRSGHEYCRSHPLITASENSPIP